MVFKSVGIWRTRLGHHFLVLKQREELSKFQQQGLRYKFVRLKYSNIDKMSGQTSKLMAHDKAEPSRLKQELKRCKNELVTQKELLIGSVNRSKRI